MEAKNDDFSSLAKSIKVNEAKPPPPLRKAPNMENGFPKARPLNPKIKINLKKKGKAKKPVSMADLASQDFMDGPNQNDLPFKEETLRFDFDGNNISNMKESIESHNAGLHQHNDNAEKPGYAIYELSVLCRSQNTSQRAFALGTVLNIVRNNFDKIEKDIKESQMSLIAVTALFPPTNLSVKSAAIELIRELMFHQFKNPFDIYPYPAIPPKTSMTFEFETHIPSFVEASKKNEECLDFLTLFPEKIDEHISQLENLPPSIPLFHLSRSLYISKGTVFAKDQALKSITSDNEDLAIEAAVVLRFIKEIPEKSILDNLTPKILAVLLSRSDNIENYLDFLPKIIPLCPNPFAVEFVANCAAEGLISKEKAESVAKIAEFSPAYITLMKFLDQLESVKIPELPTTIEECWTKRGLICGVSEYILQSNNVKYLPKLLPCLHSFTNPAADMIADQIFGMRISKERPVDPNEFFESLETCDAKQLKKILEISHYFPLHYSLALFNRQDQEEISPIVSEFLDNFEDPLSPQSLRPLDLSKFFERFLFDCFTVPSFQKMAFFCISKGADPEVRQHFWTHCSKYLSRMMMKNIRKDVINEIEDDREILSCIIQALKESRPYETDILKIAVHYLREYLIIHRGDFSGEVFFEHCRRLPEFWSSKILSFMEKK